jgi:hypothetical protein
MTQTIDDHAEQFQDRVHQLLIDRRGIEAILADCDLLERDTTKYLTERGEDHQLLVSRRTLAGIRLMLVQDKGGDVDLALRVFRNANELGSSPPTNAWRPPPSLVEFVSRGADLNLLPRHWKMP